MRYDHAPHLAAALDALVGPGAQFERACDRAEHDESGFDADSGCVWCEARAALRTYRAPHSGCLHWADSDEPIEGGDGPCTDCGLYYVEQ